MTRKRDKKKRQKEEKGKWETPLVQLRLQLQGRRLPLPRVLRFHAVEPSGEAARYRFAWLFGFACRILMNCRRRYHRGPR